MVVLPIGGPIVGSDVEWPWFRDHGNRSSQARVVVRPDFEVEFAGGRHADDTDEGVIAIAHPGSPVELAVGGDDPVLTAGTHSWNPVGLVIRDAESQRAGVGMAARENGVSRSGGAGAVAWEAIEIGKDLAGAKVELLARVGAAHGVKRVVANDELEVPVRMIPKHAAVRRRNRDEIGAPGTGDRRRPVRHRCGSPAFRRLQRFCERRGRRLRMAIAPTTSIPNLWPIRLRWGRRSRQRWRRFPGRRRSVAADAQSWPPGRARPITGRTVWRGDSLMTGSGDWQMDEEFSLAIWRRGSWLRDFQRWGDYALG